MAVTLNASTTAGLVQTADTSGVLALQTAGTTAVTISSGQVATFAQAPVLPAASIPQAALAAGVAGNGPAFTAYTNVEQTITNATFTQIAFQVEEFDTNSNFSSNTFTPTVAGYYQITATIVAKAATTLSRFIISIYKNGATTGRQWDCDVDTNAFWFATGSRLIYCNGTTDAITVYLYMEGTGTLKTGSTDANTNYFSGVLVRSA